jgi:phage shock protein A
MAETPAKSVLNRIADLQKDVAELATALSSMEDRVTVLEESESSPTNIIERINTIEKILWGVE